MKATATAGVFADDQPFRTHLAGVFAAKQAANPRFSLRAFALQLGLEHATLSQLLRGKRPFTAAQITRIGAKLGMDVSAYLPKPTRAPLPLVAHPGDPELHSSHQAWLPGAILELTTLSWFRPDTCWIAATLAVAPDEVNVALQQLLRSGQLVMRARDRWEDATQPGTVALDPPDDARLAAHAAACRAIARVPAHHRPQAHAVLAHSQAQHPEVMALIGRFQRELAALAAEASDPEAVYQVLVSCVPLTDPGAP